MIMMKNNFSWIFIGVDLQKSIKTADGCSAPWNPQFKNNLTVAHNILWFIPTASICNTTACVYIK